MNGSDLHYPWKANFQSQKLKTNEKENALKDSENETIEYTNNITTYFHIFRVKYFLSIKFQ